MLFEPAPAPPDPAPVPAGGYDQVDIHLKHGQQMVVPRYVLVSRSPVFWAMLEHRDLFQQNSTSHTEGEDGLQRTSLNLDDALVDKESFADFVW